MGNWLRKEPAIATAVVSAVVGVAAAVAKDRWDIDVDPVAAAGFLLALLGVSTVTIRSVVSSPATVEKVAAEANEQGAQYAYAAAKAEAADQVLNAPQGNITVDLTGAHLLADPPPSPPARADPPAPPSVGLWPGQAPPRRPDPPPAPTRIPPPDGLD